MSDLISRQAVLDIVDDLNDPDWYDCWASEARKRIVELPSAQPKEVRINLNERVRVKLTDYGKEIYYHRVDDVNRRYGREVCKPSFPKVDKDGYSSFVLWDFMNLYGEHMTMGSQNVIKPLEIVYEAWIPLPKPYKGGTP